MSKLDILTAEPFLTPDYEAIIQPFGGVEELMQTFGDPKDLQAKTLDVIRGSHRYVSEQRRSLKNKALALPKQIISYEDAVAVLQQDTAEIMVHHNNLGSGIQLLAHVTGRAKVIDPKVAERGHALGAAFVETRARYAASTILRASDVLYVCEETVQSGSVWDRSQAVSARHPKLRNPTISAASGSRYGELKGQAVAAASSSQPKRLSKESGSAIARSFRGIGLGRRLRLARSSTVNGVENDLDMVEGIFRLAVTRLPAKPLDFDPATICHTIAVVNKIREIVNNAASRDPTIAADPAARYFAYIFQQLEPACNVGRRQVDFTETVAAVAGHLRESVQI